MIDFSEAFKEACMDLMPDRERVEQLILINKVNELSKMVKYGI